MGNSESKYPVDPAWFKEMDDRSLWFIGEEGSAAVERAYQRSKVDLTAGGATATNDGRGAWCSARYASGKSKYIATVHSDSTAECYQHKEGTSQRRRLVRLGYCWSFETDSIGTFQLLPVWMALQLELCLADLGTSGPIVFKKVGRETYEVNLVTMTQRNLRTGKRRILRREPYPGAVQWAMPTQEAQDDSSVVSLRPGVGGMPVAQPPKTPGAAPTAATTTTTATTTGAGDASGGGVVKLKSLAGTLKQFKQAHQQPSRQQDDAPAPSSTTTKETLMAAALNAARAGAIVGAVVGLVHAVYVGYFSNGDVGEIFVTFVSEAGLPVGLWVITEFGPQVIGAFVPMISAAVTGAIQLGTFLWEVLRTVRREITPAALWDRFKKLLGTVVVPLGISVGVLVLLGACAVACPPLAIALAATGAAAVAGLTYSFVTSDLPVDNAYVLLGCGTRDALTTIERRGNRLLAAAQSNRTRSLIVAAMNRIFFSRNVVPSLVIPTALLANGHAAARGIQTNHVPTFDVAYFQDLCAAINIPRCAGGPVLGPLDQLGYPNLYHRDIIVENVTASPIHHLPAVASKRPSERSLPNCVLSHIIEDPRLLFGGDHVLLFRGGWSEARQTEALKTGAFYRSDDPQQLGAGVYFTDNMHKATNYCHSYEHPATPVEKNGRRYIRCFVLATIVETKRPLIVGRQRGIRETNGAVCASGVGGADVVIAPRESAVRHSFFAHNEFNVLTKPCHAVPHFLIQLLGSI